MDFALAAAVAAESNGALRWCEAARLWLAFDGSRLNPAAGGASLVAGRHLSAAGEAVNGAAIAELLELVAIQPGVAVEVDELDADPWLLATPAGVVDVRDGAVSAADASRLMTRCTAAAPSDAASGAFSELVAAVLPEETGRKVFETAAAMSLLTPAVAAPMLVHVGGPGALALLRPLFAAAGDYGKAKWPTGGRARCLLDPGVGQAATITWSTLPGVGQAVQTQAAPNMLELSDTAAADPGGVLRWVIDRVGDWYGSGAGSIAAAVSPDQFAEFAVAHLRSDPAGWAWSTDIYETYEKFASERGERAETHKWLSDQLKACGYINKPKSKTRRMAYMGVSLVDAKAS